MACSVHRALEESPGGTLSGRLADKPAPCPEARIRHWHLKRKNWSSAWKTSCWRSHLLFNKKHFKNVKKEEKKT